MCSSSDRNDKLQLAMDREKGGERVKGSCTLVGGLELGEGGGREGGRIAAMTQIVCMHYALAMQG